VGSIGYRSGIIQRGKERMRWVCESDCERTRGRASIFAILNVPRHLFGEFTDEPSRRAGIDVKMTRIPGQNA